MALHTILTDKLSENPDNWGRELSEKIEMEIFLFNNHFHLIQEKDLTLVGDQDFAGIPRLQNITIDQRKSIIEEALINNTFLSIFRDVVIYIDKVLSLYLWTKQTQKDPIPIEFIDDLSAFLENQPNEEYKRLTRSMISFPGKLEMISNLNERSLSRLKAYNDIRVSFEHHGGIAKKNISLPLSSIENKSNDQGLISVMINLAKVEELFFTKDEKIKLMPQDVTIIGFDIKGWIIKDILIAIEELDKNT